MLIIINIYYDFAPVQSPQPTSDLACWWNTHLTHHSNTYLNYLTHHSNTYHNYTHLTHHSNTCLNYLTHHSNTYHNYSTFEDNLNNFNLLCGFLTDTCGGKHNGAGSPSQLGTQNTHSGKCWHNVWMYTHTHTHTHTYIYTSVLHSCLQNSNHHVLSVQTFRLNLMYFLIWCIPGGLIQVQARGDGGAVRWWVDYDGRRLGGYGHRPLLPNRRLHTKMASVSIPTRFGLFAIAFFPFSRGGCQHASMPTSWFESCALCFVWVEHIDLVSPDCC